MLAQTVNVRLLVQILNRRFCARKWALQQSKLSGEERSTKDQVFQSSPDSRSEEGAREEESLLRRTIAQRKRAAELDERSFCFKNFRTLKVKFVLRVSAENSAVTLAQASDCEQR